MSRWFRRLLLLGVVAVAGALVARSRRPAIAVPAGAPTWPPLRIADDFSDVARGAVPDAGSPTPGASRWVPPVNGECPPGFPVKANDNSGIYHRPGGRFYERTVPERCYADPADAAADGYRAAKA